MIGEVYKMWKAEQENRPTEGDILLATTLFKNELDRQGITNLSQRQGIWDAACAYGDAVEAFAFREGFHMAWNILKELESGKEPSGGPGPGGGKRTEAEKPTPAPAPVDDPEEDEEDAPLCVGFGRGPGVQEPLTSSRLHEIAEQAMVTFQANKWGKRIQFNRAAAAMLGGCRRVDMHYHDGKLYIYPTDEGEFRVVKGNTNGHVQICCASIIDRIVLDGTRRRLEARDNHFVIRVA